MTPEAGWGEGPLKLHARDYTSEGFRAGDEAGLPVELRNGHGGKMRLFDDSGHIGEATVGALSLLGRVVVSPELEAEAVWSMSSVSLVAKLQGDRKTIARARWARAATLPEPMIVKAQVPT